MTSFAPPCFSWELYSEDGQVLIETASDIDLSLLRLSEKEEQELRERIYMKPLRVRGITSSYIIASPSNTKGIRFTAHEVQHG